MFLHSKRSDNTKNSSSSMKLDVRLKKKRSCINFVANEHHSFTSVFTFSVVVVDLPTDCILSFLFPAETDVLVPVFSQSTDVVVVSFVVVLKFPNACAYFSDEVMATAFFFYSARRRNFATTYVFSLLLLRVITMLDTDTADHVPAT